MKPYVYRNTEVNVTFEMPDWFQVGTRLTRLDTPGRVFTIALINHLKYTFHTEEPSRPAQRWLSWRWLDFNQFKPVPTAWERLAQDAL